ncbi:MAG: glycerate kinase [Actinomycetaceae bacterium]|nr:glycerate kinase [Actinomycetaceae bacterium]
MKIVCAPDSFKESMSAAEAAAALAEGIHRVIPGAQCVEVPMADGGEGFTESLADALGARRIDVPLRNAIGEDAVGTIAVAGERAILEIAQAVGLGMVLPQRRRIREMTSFGVGQLIAAALDAGAREFLIGLGGSGTNDGGAGMLRALGVRFLDADGCELDGSPQSLTRLETIDRSGLDARLSEAVFKIACDVDNPLLGELGASAIYGPQKGASPEDVEFLDGALARLAEVAGDSDGFALLEGAGAAGGLGYAMCAFLGGTLQSGVDLVVETVGLADAVAGADFVFTGEGAMDRQTLMGKTLSGVARVAGPAGVPIVAFAGKLGEGVEDLYDHGFVALVPIVSGVSTLGEALAGGRANLADAAERATRLILAGRG